MVRRISPTASPRKLRIQMGLVFIVMMGLVPLPSAVAQSVTLQNDSLGDGASGNIQAGFGAGEKAAAWLTSPCDGSLTTIEILWISLGGGTGTTSIESVGVNEAGVFPLPGAQLASVPGLLFTDGFLNETVLTSPVPVQADLTYVLWMEFSAGPPSSGPSVVTDLDGCQAGKNTIFLDLGIWVSSCDLGVSGDFVIRGVVECSGASDEIFSDDLESGDDSAWSSVVR